MGAGGGGTKKRSGRGGPRGPPAPRRAPRGGRRALCRAARLLHAARGCPGFLAASLPPGWGGGAARG